MTVEETQVPTAETATDVELQAPQQEVVNPLETASVSPSTEVTVANTDETVTTTATVDAGPDLPPELSSSLADFSMTVVGVSRGAVPDASTQDVASFVSRGQVSSTVTASELEQDIHAIAVATVRDSAAEHINHWAWRKAPDVDERAMLTHRPPSYTGPGLADIRGAMGQFYVDALRQRGWTDDEIEAAAQTDLTPNIGKLVRESGVELETAANVTDLRSFSVVA